ncbi:MAG: hypothetical protein GY861_09455 [bacterium]|nr:hypothetical protein [bacterium]
MKKILLILLLMLVISSALVSAACYVNDKEVPCDVFWKDYGVPGLLIILFIFLLIVVWMIFLILIVVDFTKRVRKNPELKKNNWAAKWLLIMLLTGPIGFIAYYFKVYRKKI